MNLFHKLGLKMKTKFLKKIIMLSIIPLMAFAIIAQEPPKNNEKQSEAVQIDKELAKTKFIEAKCNTCHAFSQYSIEAKNKSPNNKAPDLSNIKIEYDKEFIIKFLHKEEKINNKSHPVAFKGNHEDLVLIVDLIFISHSHKNHNSENEEKK